MQAKIAKILKFNLVALNRGLTHGVHVGMLFQHMYTPVIVSDPDSGVPLDTLERKGCEFEIVESRPSISLATNHEIAVHISKYELHAAINALAPLAPLFKGHKFPPHHLICETPWGQPFFEGDTVTEFERTFALPACQCGETLWVTTDADCTEATEWTCAACDATWSSQLRLSRHAFIKQRRKQLHAVLPNCTECSAIRGWKLHRYREKITCRGCWKRYTDTNTLNACLAGLPEIPL